MSRCALEPVNTPLGTKRREWTSGNAVLLLWEEGVKACCCFNSPSSCVSVQRNCSMWAAMAFWCLPSFLISPLELSATPCQVLTMQAGTAQTLHSNTSPGQGWERVCGSGVPIIPKISACWDGWVGGVLLKHEQTQSSLCYASSTQAGEILFLMECKWGAWFPLQPEAKHPAGMVVPAPLAPVWAGHLGAPSTQVDKCAVQVFPCMQEGGCSPLQSHFPPSPISFS